MQKELDTRVPGRVSILGVNDVGQESGNDAMVSGRTLPLLQNTEAADVWNLWQVTYRDVVVLDGENKEVFIYNLTLHNLGVPDNYRTLEDKLVELGSAP